MPLWLRKPLYALAGKAAVKSAGSHSVVPGKNPTGHTAATMEDRPPEERVHRNADAQRSSSIVSSSNAAKSSAGSRCDVTTVGDLL